jgi:hypothetical protein
LEIRLAEAAKSLKQMIYPEAEREFHARMEFMLA